MRHGPETESRGDPGDERKERIGEDSRLVVVLVEPGTGGRQEHPQSEEVQEGRQPRGGQSPHAALGVLEVQDDAAPRVAGRHQADQADQLTAQGLTWRTTGSGPGDEHGVEGDEQVEGHLHAERPRRGEAV